jgi:flagellar motor switch protein FliG
MNGPVGPQKVMANISGLHKAAVMLTSLPEREAALLLAKLGPKQVNVVLNEIAKLGPTDVAEQAGIVNELANAIPSPFVIGSGKQVVLDRLRRQIGSVPFGFLHQLDNQSLLALLVDEQPQTIAVVACHLRPVQRADIVAGLPPEQQLAVIRRIANMSETSPALIRDIEKGLADSVLNQRRENVGGINCVAEIFSFIDRQAAEGLLERLAYQDATLADELRARLLPKGNTPAVKNAGQASPQSTSGPRPARAA